MGAAKDNIREIVEQAELAIQKGHKRTVVAELSKIRKGEIPRRYAVRIANLYRRANLPLLSLEVLSCFVRPKQSVENASADEIIEYSLALIQIGASHEAKELLLNVDSEIHPQVYLAKIYCHTKEWDYASTIPIINDYLENTPGSDYECAVAEMNLASAFIHSGLTKEAAELSSQLIEKSQSNQWNRLEVNALVTKAQAHVLLGEYSQAKENLRAVEQAKTSDTLYDRFMERKWIAILESRESGKIDGLQQRRQEALQLEHWESVRDIDFHIYYATKDSDLLDQLYYGTPLKHFRSRLSSEDIARLSPRFYVGGEKPQQLDMALGRFNDKEVFPLGGNLHKLFHCLMSDFYSPISFGRIFNFVFEGEHFCHISTSNRVHQLLKRARGLIKSENMDMELKVEKGSYQLEFGIECCAVRQYSKEKTERSDIRLEKLSGAIEHGEFSAKQAREILGVSTSSMTRMLKSWLDENQISKSGTGNKVRYKLSS